MNTRKIYFSLYSFSLFNKKMNRRGEVAGSTLLFLGMFFVIIVIIFGGIVLGMLAFFGKGYDFRGVEARDLIDDVRVCFFKEDFFDPSFEISKCRLNEEVLAENHLIYVKDDKGKEFFVGVLDYKNQCFFEGAKANENFPKCEPETIIKDGREFELIVGTNQDSRRVAA